MKLLDKIKNAIFEDDDLEEVENEHENELKENDDADKKEEVVRQIDVEKTIPKRETISLEDDLDLTDDDDDEEYIDFPKREHRKTPVIFDEEDFIMEEENMSLSRAYYDDEEEIASDKNLYSGYGDDKHKKKFKPSPVLSPVYGFVGPNEEEEKKPTPKKKSSLNEMFKNDKKEKVTIEKVREKAYGTATPVEDDELLYDMQHEDAPAISKITIGDAEEYFEDLGLEYNVDYKDAAKEKEKIVKKAKDKKMEEELPEVESDLELPELADIPNLEETAELETLDDLEITKEQLKPKSADEIKKVKKITDSQLQSEAVDDADEPDEKNLYDLIDMMYESNE